ncbi:MAG: recombination mediator RecR [Candidatus Gygaella obscura]|nr:recombination mediator RecR [Candidatus Gygaella obscura]
MKYPLSIEQLIESLVKFPGVGRRSAERIINYILDTSKDDIEKLANALLKVKSSIRLCKVCSNLSDDETCLICKNSSRDKDTICVVEYPNDVIAIEKTSTYKGVYHVLMGSISPLDGRGPDDIKIERLVNRIKTTQINEIIIATGSDMEGEATSMYIVKILKPLNVKISRIGLGIPMGSNLEYIDSATLTKAIETRREFKNET